MSLADILIIAGLIIIFGLVIRFFIKEHKRGVPLDCISCPLINDQVFDHSSCDHHQHFNASTLIQIKQEIHQGLEQKRTS